MTRALPHRSPLLVVGLGIGLLGLGAALWFWPSTSPRTPEPDGAWAPPIRVASGEAVRGPWRMNESEWRFLDDPTVALGDDGVAGVLWTDHARQDLFFQTYGPDGQPRRDAPVNVSRSPGVFSWLPRMAFPEGDPTTIYVLWQEIIFSGGTHGGEILFARSTDGGRSFSDPVNLSRSEAGDGKGRLTEQYWHNGSLDLAVGPEGTLHVAWTEYEGRLWYRRSADGGRRFSEAVHVTGGAARPARGPALDVDAGRTVHLAWAVGETPSADIHYTRSCDGGASFAAPRPVAASDGHADAPKLAVTADGTVHLAYGERPAGQRGYHVRYVRSTTDSTFTTPRVLSRPLPTPYAEAHFPHLRRQPDGTLHVLWELFPTAQGRPRALGYTRSIDGGDTFAAPAVVPGTDSTRGFNGSQQGFLMEKLAVNAAGGVAVVNSTFQRGEASHIWLYRRQPTSP